MKTVETVCVRCHLDILPYMRVTRCLFCHTRVSVGDYCAIHTCHVVIFLPYTRIARYRYAASTDNTEGGRAQHSPVSISLFKPKGMLLTEGLLVVQEALIDTLKSDLLGIEHGASSMPWPSITAQPGK